MSDIPLNKSDVRLIQRKPYIEYGALKIAFTLLLPSKFRRR